MRDLFQNFIKLTSLSLELKYPLSAFRGITRTHLVFKFIHKLCFIIRNIFIESPSYSNLLSSNHSSECLRDSNILRFNQNDYRNLIENSKKEFLTEDYQIQNGVQNEASFLQKTHHAMYTVDDSNVNDYFGLNDSCDFSCSKY